MINRRQFLERSGWVAGGITVLTSCGFIPVLPTFGASNLEDASTWVQLRDDGSVQFYLPRSEMGQGISTGLSQVVAEELMLPMAAIHCHYQNTAVMEPCQMTVGSESIENYYELTARSAAMLRTRLQEIAARRYSLPVDSLAYAKAGFLLPSGQRIGYAELVAERDDMVIASAEELAAVDLLTQRDRREFDVVGKQVEPVRINEIITGQETYSRDVRVDGMVYGAVAKPPKLGARLVRYDETAALAITGVLKVVAGPDGEVGILAEVPEVLTQAMLALAPDFEPLSDEALLKVQQSLDIDDAVKEGILDHVIVDEGSLEEGRSRSARTYSFRYDSPMAAHAAMEPRSGVAHYRLGPSPGCEIWTGSQDPWLVRNTAAVILDMAPDDVTVHNCRVGGAFGGRILCQASIEAAWLSKAINKPVKVQWSREEEFSYNYVGPQFSTRIQAGLDENGGITHWHHQMVGSPILTSSSFVPPHLHWAADLVQDAGTMRGANPPYSFPNRKVEFGDIRLPMPTGAWRGLGAAPNTFAIECAMDELSAAADVDPIEFRIRHSNNERLNQVLIRLAEIADFSQPLGIAATVYKGVTFVAVAAQVSLQGAVPSVEKLWCVHDCGLVISPDQVRAQIEGNLVWGISMALHEQYVLENGIAATVNFDRYHVASNREVPSLVIELIDSGRSPSGAGEAAFAPTAAAICNGVFRQSGERIRSLPLIA